MEGKKVKRLLVIAAILFFLFAVIIMLAAGIYFFAAKIALSTASCAAELSISAPVLMLDSWFDDPLILWIVVAAAAVIVIALIILIIALSVRSKKKKKLAQASTVSDADGSISFDIMPEPSTGPAVTFDEPDGEDIDAQAASDAADAFISESIEKDAPMDSGASELLAKYIRDVNETAEEYREIGGTLALSLEKRSKLKDKASDIQKRLFRSHSLEMINRYSLTLNKIYKLIAKHDDDIAAARKKKNAVASKLKDLRRAASSYINITQVPFNVVSKTEDEIIFDIVLAKRLVAESAYFSNSLDNTVYDKIEEKKNETAELEAEYVYWEQSVAEAADEDAKLEGMIKLLEIEEKLDDARDELSDLLCSIPEGDAPFKSVDEITAAVKKEIKPGNGIVTRDQLKIKARKTGK